ncbi:NACHT, LRR and PYD domains-containing protein 12-like [Dendronephthya gigantea]|uniref:NACHT, LRR and PYD domains-containing protein 12-like n=1 Tax=Dendronephthya gigantea TaxID=151771 RepID=UPI00106959DB|nr:NACHT, LRR and PYD domains-containing protein 12-like [Dendronephthya gigantea]
MIDAAKGYLKRETFSTWAYAWSIVHLLYGLAFTGFVIASREGEAERFTCRVASESSAAYKMQVDKSCYSRYQQEYNSPLSLSWFVMLSIWFPIIVAVGYSLAVRSRIVDFDLQSLNTRQTGTLNAREAAIPENQVHNKLNVFYCYFSHLAIRFLTGMLFTILQYAVFFPNGFDFEYNCTFPPSPFNASTPITCENPSAPQKKLLSFFVSVLNTGFALTMLVEMVRVLQRLPNCKCRVDWGADIHFITAFLLGQLKSPKPKCLEECVEFYKRQVLQPALDMLYINLVIHTERAPHKFSRDMRRQETLNVYMKVPHYSICLEKASDLFSPNKDTRGMIPRTILVVGRPGIGKTVLTEKIIHDWASGIDDYSGKIAFFLKFRWFDLKELKNLTLKTFLRLGTGLTDEKFEKIYEHITKDPEKAIFVFDGLDEFASGIECLDSLQPPNDPDICMSAFSLFIKLISGNLLHGATVLVTSRPTASELFSRFKFDRTVEIIGFTPEKIEEYIKRFCDIQNTGDLNPDEMKQKIWSHIKSTSDLLSLCYIPANCLIVSSILLECFTVPQSETSVLPKTLTELYQAAIIYLGKHHCRKLDGQSSEKAMGKLQLLAYNGIVHGQLVFEREAVDQHMEHSGLLNSLYNPIHPIEEQFCFIHLTIQEFLAAMHVIKVFTPEEVKSFIISHIEFGKWQLVLQFIAGILGRKMKMCESNLYKDCVLAFSKSIVVDDGEVNLKQSLFAIKCLRELADEDILEEVCETSPLNDIVSLKIPQSPNISSNDCSAVTYVWKHIKKSVKIDLGLTFLSEECYLELTKLLQQKCIEQLVLKGRAFSHHLATEKLVKAVMNSKCTIRHKHTLLTKLKLERVRINNEGLLIICELFKNRYANSLEKLHLSSAKINSYGISVLCKVLDSTLCPELRCLDLNGNEILDEGVRVLCNALIRHRLFRLTELNLGGCSLTDGCILSLCGLLGDERCNLAVLSLAYNKNITDQGLLVLCQKALAEKHCKLTNLDLSGCSLTYRCVPELCRTLQDKHCKLAVLSLAHNKGVGREGLRLLCEYALTRDHCKLVKLNLARCSIADQCIPELCQALQDEQCKLTDLSLGYNIGLSDEGLRTLCGQALTKENCKVTKLNLSWCSLTDQCIPILCTTLQHERCKLTDLSIGSDKGISDEGLRVLCERALTNERCKLAKLDMSHCSLTDRCIPVLCEALQDEHCGLCELFLKESMFSSASIKSLREITTYGVCRSRGLKLILHYRR